MYKIRFHSVRNSTSNQEIYPTNKGIKKAQIKFQNGFCSLAEKNIHFYLNPDISRFNRQRSQTSITEILEILSKKL